METNLEKNPLKGQALIALAAAAGVVVASRLSRTGLAVTAGLAWHLWNSRKARPDPVQVAQPEAAAPPVTSPAAPVTTQEEANQPPDLPSEAEPIIEPAAIVPVPAPIEETHSPAWDDLRAALAPSLEGMSEEGAPAHIEPETEASWPTNDLPSSTSLLTPPLPEIHPFPATDPWIEAIEPMPLPADARPALPEPEKPDFLIDPEEPPAPAAEKPPHPAIPGTTTLQPRPVLPPNIIARPETGSPSAPVPMATSPGLVMPSSQEDHGKDTDHSRDEDKKSFFDWLRS